jgi:DNA polymerase-3 subunit delta'
VSEPDDVREPDQLAGVPLPEHRQRVIGHDAPRADILDALAAARLPGGMLLYGPRGIGKATLAFDIARQIFSRTGDETPEHVAAQVAAGAYPNLRVLRKAPRETGKGFYTAIRVEDVRGLIEESRMTRGRAGFRIVIVDSIDDCNPSSANALLKILEEPPLETLFMLVSHRPGGGCSRQSSRAAGGLLFGRSATKKFARYSASGQALSKPSSWQRAGPAAATKRWRSARMPASPASAAG